MRVIDRTGGNEPDVRIGLVGCGRLAQGGYVPALYAARRVRAVAVADPDPARRRETAALAGELPAFPAASALLDAVRVDGLVLATPASAHLADARTAATAGVPVLVEKPPALDEAQAVELAALDPAPRIAFNRRFEPGLAELRAPIPDGGGLVLWLDFSYRRRGWRPHTVADDALTDVGPHLIDLARWISRAEVTGVDAARFSPTRARLELHLGPTRARIRCATDRPHTERVEIADRRGKPLGRREQGGLLAALRGRLNPPSGPHPLVASLTAQIEAFAGALRGASEPTLGRARDGVAVMATIDAARRCATAAAAVPVTVQH